VTRGARPRGDLLGTPLSAREREVVRWLTAGLSRADIAGRLGVGEETVKTHLAHIYRKLGAANRHEVAARHVSSLTGTPVSSAGAAPRPGSPSVPTAPAAPNAKTPPTRKE